MSSLNTATLCAVGMVMIKANTSSMNVLKACRSKREGKFEEGMRWGGWLEELEDRGGVGG